MRTLIGGLCVGLCLLAASVAWAVSPKEAVRQTFEDYRNALQDRQGDIAGFLVTAETLAFYDTAAQAALHATSDDLAGLPLVQQLLALRMRQAIPAETLAVMRPEDLVAMSVTTGLIDPGGIRDLQLGPVEVDGDVAVAPQVDPWGRDIGVVWRFRRVQGTWKVDLRPSLMAANAFLETLRTERGLSRERLLLTLVQQSSGRRVDESLLTPPAGPRAGQP